MGKKANTIVYVNFAPYENAGNVLTYIIDTYSTVISFTFNFHKVSENQQQSSLNIYINKRRVYSCRLFQTPTSPELAFVLLPIRSLVILAQLLYHLVRLRKRYGPYNIYFTVNALTAWAGNILRTLHLVKYTVFWIWDYYPPVHDDLMVMFMRYLYWQFDKPASRESDRIVLLNNRLGVLRKQMGVLPKTSTYKVVGIGTRPIKEVVLKSKKNPAVIFLGVLKKSQGLELLFSSADKIHKLYPSLTFQIIGGGPDEGYYRKLADTCPVPTVFHGYIEDDKKVDKILNSCHIGIAPYIPDKTNVAYYTDPSKIKRYLETGLPVITTNVFSFSSDIKKDNAGIIIPYQTERLIAAIRQILIHYSFFQQNALLLAKKHNYQSVYPSMFPNTDGK
jgi:glycosyltransferase involved in cell wall biosynthesis